MTIKNVINSNNMMLKYNFAYLIFSVRPEDQLINNTYRATGFGINNLPTNIAKFSLIGE